MKPKKAPTLKRGDRVMFAADFLHNTGQFCGDVPFMVGTILSFTPVHADRSLVTVNWDNGECSRVLNVNLVRRERLHLEPR